MIVGFFGFFEIRILCSHCPHYAEPGSSLKCWANYGAPKLWAFRPGPLSLVEKFGLIAGFAVIWGAPVLFLLAGRRWFLLLIYLFAVAGFFLTVKLFFCPRCMNFGCPLNSVDPETRSVFFRKNPKIARAWGKETGGDQTL